MASGHDHPHEPPAADRAGGVLGAGLERAARMAFVSGRDLGLATGAAVAVAGALVALAVMPGRHDPGGTDGGSERGSRQ